MSALLFCCFLFSFLSVSSGRGQSPSPSQIDFAPYHHGTSFSRLNSLLRFFSRMNQLPSRPHPPMYGHPERGYPHYYPSSMMPEYPMDYYPPVYPSADDMFYPNYHPQFDQRFVGNRPEESPYYGYGGMFGYDEDAFIDDYLMSTLPQPVFQQKPFPKRIAVFVPYPLRGPFGPQGSNGISSTEIGSLVSTGTEVQSTTGENNNSAGDKDLAGTTAKTTVRP